MRTALVLVALLAGPALAHGQGPDLQTYYVHIRWTSDTGLVTDGKRLVRVIPGLPPAFYAALSPYGIPVLPPIGATFGSFTTEVLVPNGMPAPPFSSPPGMWVPARFTGIVTGVSLKE